MLYRKNACSRKSAQSPLFAERGILAKSDFGICDKRLEAAFFLDSFSTKLLGPGANQQVPLKRLGITTMEVESTYKQSNRVESRHLRRRQRAEKGIIRSSTMSLTTLILCQIELKYMI